MNFAYVRKAIRLFLIPLRLIIRNMIKRLFLLAGLLFFFCSSRAQFDTLFIKTNIRRCADSLTHAFKTRNWDVFTRYSYPALVGALGGKKEFGDYIAGMFNTIPDSAWKKYEAGKVIQVLKTGGDYQAIIELNSIIEWQGSRTTNIAYLIANSWDGGMFWTFFDSQGDVAAAKLIKPDLDGRLTIPPQIEKKEGL